MPVARSTRSAATVATALEAAMIRASPRTEARFGTGSHGTAPGRPAGALSRVAGERWSSRGAHPLTSESVASPAAARRGRDVDNSAHPPRFRGERGLSPAAAIGHAYGVPKGQLEIRDHLNDRRGSFGTLHVRPRLTALDPPPPAC